VWGCLHSSSCCLVYGLGFLKAEPFGCFCIQKDLMEIGTRDSRESLLWFTSNFSIGSMLSKNAWGCRLLYHSECYLWCWKQNRDCDQGKGNSWVLEESHFTPSPF
jgi:hypothetical protein